MVINESINIFFLLTSLSDKSHLLNHALVFPSVFIARTDICSLPIPVLIKDAVTENNLGNGVHLSCKMWQHLLNFVIVPLCRTCAVLYIYMQISFSL